MTAWAVAASIDWSTAASAATALGTLVLALATFSVVRSGRRSAQATEMALMAGIRPLVMPSHTDDPDQKVSFVDEHWVHVGGGRAAAEATTNAVYLVVSLRNVGNGLAILDRWDLTPYDVFASGDPAELNRRAGQQRPRDIGTIPPADERPLSPAWRTWLLAGGFARPVGGVVQVCHRCRPRKTPHDPRLVVLGRTGRPEDDKPVHASPCRPGPVAGHGGKAFQPGRAQLPLNMGGVALSARPCRGRRGARD